jgi:hypothetical protein
VVTGIYLGFKYDFSEGIWFTIKLITLGICAFLGDYTFKNFSRTTGAFLLILLLYVVALSFIKAPLLIPPSYPY